MTDRIAWRRSILVFVLCAPLALGVGYLLAMPLDNLNLALLGCLTLLIASPILLRWHHALLISTWNAALVFPLSPQPRVWVVFAGISLSISTLGYILTKKSKPLFVPSVALPLLLLLAVMAITSRLTGGFGGGDMWGQKRYFTSFAAIFGFFALTSQAIPKGRRMLFSTLFFGAAISNMIPDLLYLGGPPLYFLFSFFQVDIASTQAFSVGEMVRFTGFAIGGQAVCNVLIMRNGILGMCDLSKYWRLLFFLLFLGLSLLGGYRSMVVMAALVGAAVFCFEGLLKTRYVFIFSLAVTLSLAFVVGFADRMPLSIQRSLSVLPLELDPTVERDAAGTTDWRLQIWRVMIPQIPRYLWVGKGYAYSAADSFLTTEATMRGLAASYEEILVSGNYHSGPLTLIIPFGIFGVIAFAWFCLSGFRVLYRNYRFGDPEIKKVNIFLISYFSAYLVFFLSVYGQFDMDLCMFTGMVGFSIALNGGVAKSKPVVDASNRDDAAADHSPAIPGMASAES